MKRVLLGFLAGAMLGPVIIDVAAQKRIITQDTSRPSDAAAFIVHDPAVAAKIEVLTNKVDELKVETLKNRAAIETIQQDVNIGKGIVLAIGAIGVITFINTLLGIANYRRNGIVLAPKASKSRG